MATYAQPLYTYYDILRQVAAIKYPQNAKCPHFGDILCLETFGRSTFTNVSTPSHLYDIAKHHVSGSNILLHQFILEYSIIGAV